jgi:Arc/MetJ-type ribon-helix-helix transcriptional regulator
MFVLAIPNLVPMVVNHFAPIPPQSKILLEKDAIDRHIHKELEPKIREELSTSGKYPDLSSMIQELRRRMRMEYLKQTERIDRFHNSRIKRQLILNQQISRISPAASYVFASTHLAGTGVRDFLNVITEVDRFQQSYLSVQDEQEAKRREEEERRKKDKKAKKPEKLLDAYDPSLWPKFSPRDISLAQVLNRSWFDMVLLIGQAVILFLVAFVGFVRYDPR